MKENLFKASTVRSQGTSRIIPQAKSATSSGFIRSNIARHEVLMKKRDRSLTSITVGSLALDVYASASLNGVKENLSRASTVTVQTRTSRIIPQAKPAASSSFIGFGGAQHKVPVYVDDKVKDQLSEVDGYSQFIGSHSHYSEFTFPAPMN